MRIELLGAGREPVDFARTLLSHGVADLPPNAVAQDGSSLDTVLLIDGEARPVRVVADGPGFARIDHAAAEPVIRHMLRLDEDFGAFYLVAAADPALAWAAAGAGRMLRSPTVFEDLVKTICTTNCTWSATVRMVTALVDVLGTPASDAPERRAFPTPEAMAEAGEDFYTGVARPATAARICEPSRRRSRRDTSTWRRSTIPRCPISRSPSGCSRCRASGRTPART